MKTATVSKEDLKVRLYENRTKHLREYVKTHKAWMDKVLLAIRQAEAKFTAEENLDDLNLGFQFPKPQNHADEYDRAIEMLGWEQNEQVELSADDFRRYVQDQWAWSDGFRATSTQYRVS